MTKRAKDIQDRYNACIAERNAMERGSKQWNQLNEIARLINNEYTAEGRNNRHIMYLCGTDYGTIVEEPLCTTRQVTTIAS